MLKTYEEMAADREALLRKLDEDYTMLGTAIDARIDELKALAAGEPTGASTDAVMEAFDVMADGLRSLTSFAATTLEVFPRCARSGRAEGRARRRGAQ